MITKHTQLLNYLIDRYSLKSYCEIGVQNPENNFNKISCNGMKIGVDPAFAESSGNLIKATSDDFFAGCHEKFDIFFVDGLHHADQVKKDFENSLLCLNDGGFIVIHDTLPDEEIATCVPRGEQKKWFGDVYKWAMTLPTYRLQYVTLDIDCGCTIVRKEPIQYNADEFVRLHSLSVEPDWEAFQQHKNKLLRIVPPASVADAIRLYFSIKESVA